LAKLTNQIAMIQYPALGQSKVRSVELVSVSETKVLLLLVLDSSRIEQQQIDLATEISLEFIGEVRAKLNTLLAGRSLTSVADLIQNFESNFAPDLRPTVEQVLGALVKTVDANRTEKLVVSGTGNLARNESDFSNSITPLLDAIEEQVVLVRLLNEMPTEHLGVGLRIGSENRNDSLREATIMSAGYQDQNEEVAKLGLIGPTRMDYSMNISAVQAVARYLSKILQA
jgi:heat-inducible transcriptional repressor